MNHLTLSIGVYLAFLFTKCWNDSIYIAKKHVVPTHGLEWLQCAIVATIAGMIYSNHFWTIVSWDFWMLPISWIVEDFTINAFLGQNPLTHVGGGFWDDVFRLHFPNNTARAIWIVKLSILVVASWIFYEITKQPIP